MSNEFEKFINNNREAFDSRTPDPAVLERIQAEMRGKAKRTGILIPMKAVRLAAAACVLLIAGVSIFVVMKNDVGVTNETAQVVTKKDSPVTTEIAKLPQVELPVVEENKQPEIIHQAEQKQVKVLSAIDAQLVSQKQSLFAKLNDAQSPGRRITGAEQAYQMMSTDKDIVDALVKTMNSDPNTNVRLAALEALGRFHRENYVKKQLVESLKKQKDPMVQIQLIQLLTKMKQTNILRELEKIVDDGNTMREVKDYAYAGILTLKS